MFLIKVTQNWLHFSLRITIQVNGKVLSGKLFLLKSLYNWVPDAYTAPSSFLKM